MLIHMFRIVCMRTIYCSHLFYVGLHCTLYNAYYYYYYYHYIYIYIYIYITLCHIHNNMFINGYNKVFIIGKYIYIYIYYKIIYHCL